MRTRNHDSCPNRVAEEVGYIQAIHANASNEGVLFQVASQFNLLEMASPDVTPEMGLGIYDNDNTQGPACAISAGAGTIYRNYLVPLNGEIGQSASNQIDCLSGIGQILGNQDSRFWVMLNGYALPTRKGLAEISSKIRDLNPEERDHLQTQLQVGIQWGTQVTLPGCSHCVSQIYCSALPVAYSSLPSSEWEEFARLVLEAAYEATFCAGILNAQKTGNPRVYLTLLGGGAFGNEPSWIINAIKRALDLYPMSGLDINIVSYRTSNPNLSELY